MLSALINDPEHWRSRAEEARTIAERMVDQQARASMLRVAQEYESLAKRAEERILSGSPNKDGSHPPRP